MPSNAYVCARARACVLVTACGCVLDVFYFQLGKIRKIRGGKGFVSPASLHGHEWNNCMNLISYPLFCLLKPKPPAPPPSLHSQQ